MNKKKYNIEFVSANPTGPLHVGHCRGAVLGDTLSNLLIFIICLSIKCKRYLGFMIKTILVNLLCP